MQLYVTQKSNYINLHPKRISVIHLHHICQGYSGHKVKSNRECQLALELDVTYYGTNVAWSTQQFLSKIY